MSSEKVNYIVIFIFFTFLNILYFLTGGKFYFEHINYFWQFLDVKYLKNDLLRGIFYLHIQPPFFNLFTGLLLKNPFLPPSFLALFCFLVIGFFTVLLFYKILILLEVGENISLIFSLIFLLNPSFLMYETFYFYTLPVIFLLILSLYLLIKFFESERIIFLDLFLFSFLVLSLIRSIFHVIFFTIFFLIFFNFESSKRKKIYKRIGITIFVLFLFYLKNFLLFNTFSTSSWFGMNFAKVFVLYSAKEERIKAMKENDGCIFYIIHPFSPPSSYPRKYLVLPDKYKCIPELSEKNKTCGWAINFNYFPYIKLSKAYMEKYFRAVFLYPRWYLRGVLKSFDFFLTPAYFTYQMKVKGGTIKLLINIFNKIYLKFPSSLGVWGGKERDRDNYYMKFIIFPFFLFFVFFTFPIFIFNLRIESVLWKKMILIFIFFTIVYVMYVGILFECGENNRFRFITHAYYLIIWAVFIKNMNYVAKKCSEKIKIKRYSNK